MNRSARRETVGAWLDDLTVRFQKTSETPGLDAQVLLARVLNRPRPWLVAHAEAAVGESPAAALEDMVRQLESGQRLPYVLGTWEFFGLEWEVTPDVLIPRPETELLVETALGWLRQHPQQRRAADIGTGSGCIAVTLAVHIPDLSVLATDISPSAVQVARRNAARHRVEDRVRCACSDLIPEGERSFHLIAANLPYIPTRTLAGLPIYGHEPSLALDGGADGLDLIRRLLTVVPDRLAPGGMLLLEIEASQGPAVLSMAYDAFGDGAIHLHQDLAGRDRLLEVRA
jgi:release factor glutamine methyltransferase